MFDSSRYQTLARTTIGTSTRHASASCQLMATMTTHGADEEQRAHDERRQALADELLHARRRRR